LSGELCPPILLGLQSTMRVGFPNPAARYGTGPVSGVIRLAQATSEYIGAPVHSQMAIFTVCTPEQAVPRQLPSLLSKQSSSGKKLKCESSAQARG
jgi:hypothetical protein